MANFVFNVAKGRVHSFCKNVKDGSPSTSRLRVVAFKSSGIEADSTLKDRTTLSDITSGTSVEATNTGYSGNRFAVTGAMLTLTVDNTNDRVDIDITTDPNWTAVQTTGGAWAKLVICYDDNSGADSTLIPLTAHDFAVTPDGSDITAQINSAGFFRSTD